MKCLKKLLSFLCRSRTDNLSDPGEFGIEIEGEIKKMVKGFAPELEIKIKDTLEINAEVRMSCKCVILTKGLYENKVFTTEDRKVLVAHELGHINFKNQLEISRNSTIWELVLLAAIISFVCHSGIFPATISWFLSILAIFLGRMLLISLFHDDENRADSFAIVEASIPVKSFVQCLSRADYAQMKELARETRRTFLVKSLCKLLLPIPTHPPIEQRIKRVRALYGNQTEYRN